MKQKVLTREKFVSGIMKVIPWLIIAAIPVMLYIFFKELPAFFAEVADFVDFVKSMPEYTYGYFFLLAVICCAAGYLAGKSENR